MNWAETDPTTCQYETLEHTSPGEAPSSQRASSLASSPTPDDVCSSAPAAQATNHPNLRGVAEETPAGPLALVPAAELARLRRADDIVVGLAIRLARSNARVRALEAALEGLGWDVGEARKLFGVVH